MQNFCMRGTSFHIIRTCTFWNVTYTKISAAFAIMLHDCCCEFVLICDVTTESNKCNYTQLFDCNYLVLCLCLGCVHVFWGKKNSMLIEMLLMLFICYTHMQVEKFPLQNRWWIILRWMSPSTKRGWRSQNSKQVIQPIT